MPQLVKDGTLSVDTVDTAVSRMIYVRMRLGRGEWDPVGGVPFRDESIYSHDVLQDSLEQLSLQAAQQVSFVYYNDEFLH